MKKGFTLIELLAVIVILAVIALIAVPIVINIIEDAERNAAVRSAEGYVRAVNYKIAQEILNNREVSEEEEYIIGENELALTGNNLDGITGSYILSNSRVLFAGLCVNNYSIEYNATTGKTVFSTASNYCTGESVPEFVEPEGEYVSAACTDSTKYTNTTNFKIKTVEDLVCLSNLVNGGSNFSGKTVYLVSDIDFNSDDSYSNPSTTSYGDINGDSSTDGLKTEVTTGKGFQPIGNYNKTFSGTVEGYAFTISNLMINRPSDTYVGLFGYNAGTIRGIKIRDAVITGGRSTGGIAGEGNGTIRAVDVRATISSSDSYIGGVIGSNSGVMREAVFSGSVTGYSGIGGIAGSTGWNAFGLVYDSTLTATATGQSSIGAGSGLTNGQYRVSNVTLVYPGTRNGSNGVNFDTLRLHNVDDTIDTIIGGDNDDTTPDGYYFDYDSENKIVLYSVVRTPIRTDKLNGDGTEENPYLIKNAKDWKLATATITSTAKHYALANDLNFNNEYMYALGTEKNKFNGIFNGNFKTISNVNMLGYKETGIFGYITGTVKDLKLDGITVEGIDDRAGALAGTNTGTINGIVARNINVTGIRWVGGLVGDAGSGSTITNVDLRGTVLATSNNAGGITGSNSGVERELAFSGSVTGDSTVGGITGSSGWNSFGIVYDSTITATNTTYNQINIGKGNGIVNGDYVVSNVELVYASGKTTNGKDGTSVTNLRLHNADGIIDTYIGGDNEDSSPDGYYYDYDSNNKIILYSIAETPITNTLTGEGTQANPYEISNLADWRIATSTIGSTAKYYILTSDIDFNNEYMYALGTATNNFNGILNGNLKTLSNVSITAKSNAGIFGVFTGNVTNLKLNNITVVTTNEKAGALAGSSTGTFNGIIARNINVTGTQWIGGLVGDAGSGSTIRNADVKGTVLATSSNAGGITGSNSGVERELVFKGTVTGTNMVGGITGSSGWNSFGVVYDSTVTATDTTSSQINIGKGNGIVNGEYKVYNVTLSYDTSKSKNGLDGTTMAEKTLAAIGTTIDTSDSTNPDGYYYDLVNGEFELQISQ